jgi:signal transduction histidine kinase
LALEEPLDITDIGVFVVLAALLALILDYQRVARQRMVAAHQSVQEYAARLEREVAERSRAEEALRQSNADLEDFAHLVSHDLKEPLRGIMLTAKFTLDDHGDKLPPEGRAQLETLVRLPTRLAAMLDALLEYSRAWRADLGIQSVDLGRLVGETVDSLRPWLKEQSAEAAVVTPMPTVRCDPARASQIFGNLITNGVKYNRSEAKRVEVGATGEGALFVRDNGIGIPPDKASHIFRMFRRLHAKDEFGGGTGSGLALAKKIVERHGGRIWVESRPGQGATFFFTLCPENGPVHSGSVADLKDSGQEPT